MISAMSIQPRITSNALRLLVVACSVVVGLTGFALPALAAPQCQTLYAGQTIVAGTVCVDNDASNLTVTYQTTGGWTLDETHLWLGTDLSTMPRTASGNPKVGLFPYKSEGLPNGTTTYTFTLPLGDFKVACRQQLLVAAHAVVKMVNADGSIRTETGWGAGTRLTAKGNWATYFSYTVQCAPPPPPPLTCGPNETAYAFGDQTFIDLGITTSRWGWQITVPAGTTATAPIYAGAGQNDITKGTHVGALSYQYTGAVLTVSFNMFPGFVMDETHVYAGASTVPTISPGRYGNQHDLTAAASDTYVIPVTGDTIYLVAHAVVCKRQ